MQLEFLQSFFNFKNIILKDESDELKCKLRWRSNPSEKSLLLRLVQFVREGSKEKIFVESKNGLYEFYK